MISGLRWCLVCTGLSGTFGTILLLSGIAFADGDLTKKVTHLEPIVLGTGEEDDFAVSQTEIKLKTGKFYALPVEAKGYKKYRFEAPEFFRDIWVSQVVIDALEIHTTHIDALEFDDQGTIVLWFIALRSGEYPWHIEDFHEKGMHGTFIVE